LQINTDEKHFIACFAPFVKLNCPFNGLNFFSAQRSPIFTVPLIIKPFTMKKESKKQAEVIVLVLNNQPAENKYDLSFEVGSYVVNRCHPLSKQQSVDTLITSEPDHFIYHMPFCYRLN
jgi:hypothetical protein